MVRRVQREEYLERIAVIHGDRYDYSQANFNKAKDKIEIICPEHGSYYQRIDAHIGGQGCPSCGIKKQTESTTATIEEFVTKAKEKHEGKYDYSEAKYENAHQLVKIICPEHGPFWQKPNNHLSGNGCRKCSNELRSLSTRGFIGKAKEIHGDRYDYSKVKYRNSKEKVEIICRTHGVFYQNADSHLYAGNGCRACGDEHKSITSRSDKGTFINKAIDVHGDRYNYSMVEYTGSTAKVKIICPDHGMFQQTPQGHLMGYGCRLCSRNKSQDAWLDRMNVPNDDKHRQVTLKMKNGKTIVADGYIPETNTIYEYWGTYFHGHPNYYAPDEMAFMGKTFGELYEATQNKITAINQSGFNLVQQWAHHLKDGTEILIKENNGLDEIL